MSNHCIAGKKTSNNWADFRAGLAVGGTEGKWKEAYESYYLLRLESRYLSPIKLLQDNGTFEGEGFSIMAILCSLIEFLESTYQGKQYKYLPKGKVAGANEYSSSKNMFVSFLCNREPFKHVFSEALAQDFIQVFVADFYTKHRPKMDGAFWPNQQIAIS